MIWNFVVALLPLRLSGLAAVTVGRRRIFLRTINGFRTREGTVGGVTELPPAQNVSFPSNGRTASGYLALPANGSGPGVIVIQEWWGLDSHIVSVADRLASEGFVALAPDLYGGRVVAWAGGRGGHDGSTARRPGRTGPGRSRGLPARAGGDDLRLGGCRRLLHGREVSCSCSPPCKATGSGQPCRSTESARRCPMSPTGLTAAVQGHYGLRDMGYPPEKARALEEQVRRGGGADVEFFYYDAGHAFFNDENRMGSYVPELAALAWGRADRLLSRPARYAVRLSALASTRRLAPLAVCVVTGDGSLCRR